MLCAVILFSSLGGINESVCASDAGPGIIYVPWKLEPGDIGSVFGGGFGTDKEAVDVAIQPLTGFNGELSPESASVKVKPFNVTDQFVQFIIPKDIKYDVYAIWVKNVNGWSKVGFTNKAEIFWVNEHEVYEGQKLTVAGRNIVNPLNRSTESINLEFVEVSSGNKLSADIYDVTDYTIYCTAPKGLKVGEKYKVQYTNGTGGNYGISQMTNEEREIVTAADKNDNTKFFDEKYDLNVSWLSDVDTSKTFNIKDTGAMGDGTTNDTAAIQKTMDMASSAGGGIVYLPNGTYLTNQIKVGAKTVLMGESTTNTVLKWDGNPCAVTPRTTIKRSAWDDSDGQPKTYGETNIFIYSDQPHIGIFDLSILSDVKRPIDDKRRLIYGYFLPVGFFGACDVWKDERYPEGTISPRSDGYVLKNVNFKEADGSGPDIWSSGHVVIENCNIDVTHYGTEIRGSRYSRYRYNTVKNISRPLLTFFEARDGDKLLYEGQQYVENNRFIGDNIKRKIQAGEVEDPGWTELVSTTEHRVTDYGGDENLFRGNKIEGKVGDNKDNSGEGLQSQTAVRKVYARVASATANTLTAQVDLSTKKIENIMDYVIIIAGPGLGQVRKVADNQGDTITVDKSWDVTPTSESVFAVNHYIQARTLIVDNDISANNNKGSIHMYCNDYDTVVANNNITSGGGIWYAAVIVPNQERIDFSYFISVLNNNISGSSNVKHGQGQATTIGPGNDGGINTGFDSDINATCVYGTRILHNKVEGIGTNPTPISNFNELYALRTGIFIATPQIVSYPNAMAEIVDGNAVSNTVAGIHLSNTAYDTVIRNNDFSGTGKEVNEPSPSVNTMFLEGSDGYSPGNKPIVEINKSFLKSGAVTGKKTYDDIKGHWAQAIIEEMAQLGVVKGVSDNEFAPDSSITRAEFITLIVRCLGISSGTGQPSYDDVNASDWYASVIHDAKAANLIDNNMLIKNSILPNNNITREEMTSIIVKAIESKGKSIDTKGDLTAFSDANEVASWANEYIAEAYGLNIISGVGDSRFAPKDNLTRAEATVILQRFLQVIK